MALDKTSTFVISVDGETSKEKWVGKFIVKTQLSPREILRKDQIRRDLIGQEKDCQASLEAKSIATVFSTLWVHLMEAPNWWKDQGNGIDMVDENVATEVYLKLAEIMNKEAKEREELAEKAKAAIEKPVEVAK